MGFIKESLCGHNGYGGQIDVRSEVCSSQLQNEGSFIMEIKFHFLWSLSSHFISLSFCNICFAQNTIRYCVHWSHLFKFIWCKLWSDRYWHNGSLSPFHGLFVNDRPDLITLNFDEPDKTGHSDGPNSDKVSMVIDSRGGVMGGGRKSNHPAPKRFQRRGKWRHIFMQPSY